MMKSLGILFISLVTISSYGTGKNKMDDKKWFSQVGCEKMQITHYKPGQPREIQKQELVTDADYIKSLQYKISQLPIDGGGLMIKMAPDADYLTLTFECGGKPEIIEFYNSKIKTPSTSFFSGKNELETKIWAEVLSHFAKPSIGEALPKIKGRTYHFDDFSIQYLGMEDRTPKETTATLNVQSFQVIGVKDHSEQTLEVRSGQLPPQPVSFSVDGKKFVLNTRTSKDGVQLDPRQFVIDEE